MTELGINCAGRAEQHPVDIAALGATWCRVVAYPDTNIISWMQGCHAHGVRVLLVLAGESIGHDPSGWPSNIAMYRGRYGGLVNAWQIANESDHVSPSSWDMEPADLSMLLRIARFQLGPDEYIVGPGLVSGNPGWAADVDWSPVNALACHPYAKEPGTPELSSLIDGYAAYGRAVWVTEYHARTIGMAAALRDDPRLQVALAFSMSDSMVPGFGLLEDPAALADFKAATAGPANHPPAERHAEYVLGFAKWAALERNLLGDPLKNERNVAPEWQIQPTTKGVLSWVGGRGHAFIQHDGRVFRWQEDWAASREVPA